MFNLEDYANTATDFKTMFPMAMATSIDAISVGTSFAFIGVNIWIAAGTIGILTVLLALLAVILTTSLATA